MKITVTRIKTFPPHDQLHHISQPLKYSFIASITNVIKLHFFIKSFLKKKNQLRIVFLKVTFL